LSRGFKIVPADGSFILIFLGDNEIHLAFRVGDYDAAFKRHKEMGAVCYENPKMEIYFIEDPDGYWIEILPPGRG
jgi:lactoylglutathione lyase